MDNYKLIETHKFNFGESAFPLIVTAEVFQNRDIYKLVLSDKEAEEKETQVKQLRIDFDMWVKDEALKLVGTELEQLKTTVFNSVLGMDCSGSKYYASLKLFILIDNIENPFAKDSLCKWLHNDNKASIKLFEVYTGLTLPKTHKERNTLIMSLTKEQFKGIKEFKPRKKSDNTNKAEKELKSFYKCENDGKGSTTYKEYFGEEVRYKGWIFYVMQNPIEKTYGITEANTGLSMGTVKKKSEVKTQIQKVFDKMNFENQIKGIIKSGKHSPICSAELLKEVV